MKAQPSLKAIILFFIVGLGVTLTTFFVPREVDRTRVEKDFAPYLTAVVEGRGWPVAYLMDDPAKENFDNIGFEDKWDIAGFMTDWLFWTVMGGLMYYGLAILRGFPKKI